MGTRTAMLGQDRRAGADCVGRVQAQEGAVARACEVLELRKHVAELQQTVEKLLAVRPNATPLHSQDAALGAKVEGLKVCPWLPLTPAASDLLTFLVSDSSTPPEPSPLRL